MSSGPYAVPAGPRTPPGPPRPAAPPREVRDALLWGAGAVAGLGLTALFVGLDLRVGTAAPPFTGRYRLQVGPASLLAPAVAAGVLVAVRRGWHERLGWGRTLALGYLAAALWTAALAVVDGGRGLAAPLGSPQEYLHDVPAVAGDPVGFLRTFLSRSGDYAVATRQHPPGAVLLLWALRPLGLVGGPALGLTVALVGCLAVPLVARCVRSLCGEPAARRLLPVLALPPWALWTAVSLDAVTSTVCAGFVACGVVASEPGRSRWWAAPAGLLLGLAALLSYSAAWLGATLLALYFLRRRPSLNVVTGLAALVPLGVASLAGFAWPAGLTAAQADFSLRVGPQRSWLLWIPLDLLLVALACGPPLAPALRKVRNTPGWPFLAGAGLAVGFAVTSGLSRGEVERAFLPFFPWLLVPAVAPEERGGPPARTPVLLVGVGAASAVVVQAVLASPW